MNLSIETAAQFERLTSDAKAMSRPKLEQALNRADRKRSNGRFGSLLGFHVLLAEKASRPAGLFAQLSDEQKRHAIDNSPF